MRLLKYDVKKADGTIFTTASYAKATEGGKIIKTYLVPVDNESEKVKKQMKVHSHKVMEIYGIK